MRRPGKAVSALVILAGLTTEAGRFIFTLMLKRLAVLLMLLVLAGQGAAGVCECLAADGDVHSCCKREIGPNDVLSAPPCCNTVCVESTSKAPQWNSDNSLRKITLKVETTEPPATYHFLRIELYERPSVSPTISNNRLKLARPPRLYLRHHILLI